MEFAVIGHGFDWEFRPVRWLKIFHAFLLECVKSMSFTVSSQRFLHFLSMQFSRSVSLEAASLGCSALTNVS